MTTEPLDAGPLFSPQDRGGGGMSASPTKGTDMSQTIEKVASDIAKNLGPFTMKLLREENYSGEHREWYEEITIPRDADIVREITKAAIAAWNTRASDAEITRLTEALRDAEEREKALHSDAERYHWLRDHSCPPHNFYISVPDEFAGQRYAPDDVDAYIDAARQALAGAKP